MRQDTLPRPGPAVGTGTGGVASAPRPWVFVTWYPYCRRSDVLAEQIGARSYLVHFLKFKVPYQAPLKYVLQAVRTWWLLARDRPSLVLVANPPVIAPLVVWLGSALLRYRFIIDAHSGAFQHTRWAWSLPLQRFLARRALATIVTNDHMAGIVGSWGGRTVKVQDLALPLEPGSPARPAEPFHVVFICTHSVDEPVAQVVEAARSLPDVRFSFTGDPSYAPHGFRESLPPNIRLTGFVPEEDYLSLLRGADAILVLTTEDHTMQRGGYEAVALEKPLITSDWPLLREVFGRGTVHVDNSAAGIAEAVRRVRADGAAFQREIRLLKHERRQVSTTQVRALQDLCRAGIERERTT
jgi:glycosyltransferase involved in cell wall biosynthesis